MWSTWNSSNKKYNIQNTPLCFIVLGGKKNVFGGIGLSKCDLLNYLLLVGCSNSSTAVLLFISNHRNVKAAKFMLFVFKRLKDDAVDVITPPDFILNSLIGNPN